MEAQKDVFPPVRTSGVEEKKLSEGEGPSAGHPFGILTRNASSVSNQAAGPLTTRTRNVSKRMADIKTNCL